VAHDWRTPTNVQGFSTRQRLSSPLALPLIERASRLAFEPAFQLAKRDEAAATAPHNP
jgi:hypothetical protein